MTRRIRYPDAVREPAVKLVFGQVGEYETQWGAIRSVAEKSGMHPETLRKWVRQAGRMLAAGRGSLRGQAADPGDGT